MLFSTARPIVAQAVRVDIAPLAPYQSGSAANLADTAAVALYAMAYFGAPGTLQGVPLGTRQGYTFASVNFVFSASALPVPNGKDYDIIGNLQRLHAHITLTPLDSARVPVRSRGALEVLATLPDTLLVAQPTSDSSSSQAGVAAFNALSQTFMPVLQAGVQEGKRAGPALASFLHLYHRPSAQLQVGYLSGVGDFGWVYYGRDQIVIEGTHRTSAALELGPTTKYVLVDIALTGEWKKHGSWKRNVQVLMNISGIPSS